MVDKKVKVKLSTPTTIAGVDFKKGETVTVTEIKANILREHGFIEGVKNNE